MEFANDIGIQFKDEDKINQKKIASEIEKRLRGIEKSKILFILDNFENDETKNEFVFELSYLKNVYFLITTRISTLKKFYPESESISIELFDKKETNDFVKTSLSNSINEIQLNRIIESLNLKYENIRPYVLNKIIASIKLKIENNMSIILLDNLYDYEKDTLFDDLIKDENSWEFLQICSFFNPDYIHIFKK